MFNLRKTEKRENLYSNSALKRELRRGALFEEDYTAEEKYYRIIEVLEKIRVNADSNLYSKIAQSLDRIIILISGWGSELLPEDIDRVTLAALLVLIEKEYTNLLELNRIILIAQIFSKVRLDENLYLEEIDSLYKELSDLYLVSRKTSLSLEKKK